MEKKEYDLLVIGSGPGGYVAAIRGAQLGMKTACIEKESTLGGTCLNVGCIPSKALLQSSEYYALMEHDAATHGLEMEGLSYDFPKMMERKNHVVKGLTDSIAMLFKKNKIERIEGKAHFVDEHTVQVNDQAVAAKHIIIATGSEPIELPFLPFDEKRILSSTGILSLSNVPKKLLVIGAGVIGVELASVYQRLGTEVTLIEMLDQICLGIDKGLAKQFQKILHAQGLDFHLSAQVKEGSATDKGVALTVEENGKDTQYEADAVLVCVGRRPYTQDLGLEKIPLETTKKGQITVDNSFRTAKPHILAIGDVIDGPMLAHKASEEGMAAAEIIAGKSAHINYITIPNVIYTHPELASAGLTEEEAKEAQFKLLIGTAYFKGNPRARCAADTDGLVKVIGDEASGRLLGIHIIGSHASEMIGEAVIALENKMTLSALANASHAHPTLSEAIKDAAFAALKRPIHG